MSRPNPNPNPSPNPNPTRALTLKNLFQHRRKHPDFNVFLSVRSPNLSTNDLLLQLATAPLSQIITEQKTNIDDERAVLVAKSLKAAKQEVLHSKLEEQKKRLAEVAEKLTPSQRRLHEELCRRGSSTWLTTLPLEEHGFALNKLEFRDALSLRYDLPLHEFPNHCACGKLNSIEHSLSCSRGGYVNLRHNQMRDLEVSQYSTCDVTPSNIIKNKVGVKGLNQGGGVTAASTPYTVD
eukprot:sb/3469201/